MKNIIVNKILENIEKELEVLIIAANNAHLAAIDDQSVAETQYDTLAIEASYLAEGQSRRVQALKNAIATIKSLVLKESVRVIIGSLVQLSADESSKHWFFISPVGAGFRCQVTQQNITVITPQSPMGIALLGKRSLDDICVQIGNNQLIDEVRYVK